MHPSLSGVRFLKISHEVEARTRHAHYAGIHIHAPPHRGIHTGILNRHRRSGRAIMRVHLIMFCGPGPACWLGEGTEWQTAEVSWRGRAGAPGESWAPGEGGDGSEMERNTAGVAAPDWGRRPPRD
jgi:hypothetical protein